MDSSNPNSARTNGGRTSSSGRDSTSPRSRSIQFQVLDEEDEDDAPGDRQATEEKAITWRIFTPEQAEVAQSRAPIFGQPVPPRMALPAHATAWSLTLPRNTSASQRKLYRRSEIEPAPVMNVPMSIEVKACAARGVTMPAPITGGPSGAQSVQLPRPDYKDGAMRRSLSQSEDERGQGEREDRLVSTNGVMYSCDRPMVAVQAPTLCRPSPVPPFRVVAGAHPSGGYRPMTVAFHGFQVARPGAVAAPNTSGVRWV